jgi:8-oxo-dGTP diphosphatase
MTTADAATFSGAKLAILTRGRILTLLRDDRPDIPWPGHWDLPGGGREGDEVPLACALRETREELSLIIDPGTVRWGQPFPGALPGQGAIWFFVLCDDRLDLSRIALGDEGQRWEAMPLADYLSHPKAIGHMVRQLRVYLAGPDGTEERNDS